MRELEALKEESQDWHQQHASWVEESRKWQKETQRLSALLYLLDRALPEHSAILAKHVSLIEQHEGTVTRYENSFCSDSLKVDDNSVANEQQQQAYKELCSFHSEVEKEHLSLKQSFLTEMKKFKKLATELLNEAEEV